MMIYGAKQHIGASPFSISKVIRGVAAHGLALCLVFGCDRSCLPSQASNSVRWTLAEEGDKESSHITMSWFAFPLLRSPSYHVMRPSKEDSTIKY